MIRCISLQSGSNGNCIYVEAGDVRLLFDAGISGKRAEERLLEHGIDIRDVDALILSHDHRDHTCCAGVYQRKFGLPIWVTPRTESACAFGKVKDVRHFAAGSTLEFGKTRIHTVKTPHDGVDGVCFVVEEEDRRLGVLTDLGHDFEDLMTLLPTLDAALIESNYDDEMLEFGPYPPHLISRISGPGGHLSNSLSAQLIAKHGGRLQWLVLGHLSEENNSPEVALETHVSTHGGLCEIDMASRYEVRGAWSL